MQQITTAAPHQIQAAIAACRNPIELDRIAEQAMAKWPDLAKAARRRSAAFKAHASRAGAPRQYAPRAIQPPRAVHTMTEGSVPFNVFIVRAGGIDCMEFVTRDLAWAFAQQAERLPAAPVIVQAPAPARKAKLVTACDVAPPYSWMAGNWSAKARKMALAEWAAMEPARREWILARDAAKRLGVQPLPEKPAALADADRADMARRNAHHAERALFWREHEKEQQIIGNIWISGDLRSAAVLAQPRGQYTKNTAANEKLVRRVARWMGAARRIAADCATDEQKAAFQTRMRKLQARRKASEAAKLSTKKDA